MTVYLDVCFLINFVMDFVVFFITGVIAKSRASLKRITIVCLAESGFYCLLALSGVIFSLSGLAIAVLSNLVALYTVFKPVSIRRFLEQALIMVITAFTLCGLSIWIMCFSNIPQALKAYFGMGYGKYTAAVLIITAFTAYGFIKFSGRWIDVFYAQRAKFCRIKIYYNNSVCELTALIDSGNFLKAKDNRALIVAETGAVCSIFKENFNDFIKGEFRFLYEINYTALGNTKGLLKVIRPDKTEYIFDGKTSAFYNSDLALYNGILSPKGGYKAIISGDDYNRIRGLGK